MINSQSLTHPTQLISANAQALQHQAVSKSRLPLFLIAAHLPLGILLYQVRPLTLAYPIAVFCYGLYLAVRKQEKIERVAFLAAYLVGLEVLLRMAQSPIFWEFGKYATAAIMIVALIQRNFRRVPALPLAYFSLLIPGYLLAFADHDIGEMKDLFSSNMSGPFLLVISCWFFSCLKLNWQQLKKLFLALILPLSSVAVTTLFYTVTTEDIQFGSESNVATSGGFGPNQVSSMLGLGVFLCAAAYLLFKNDYKEKLFFGVFAVFFSAQSMMTFSRGGMYNAIGAVIAVFFLQMGNAAEAARKLLPIAAVVLVFLLLVFPVLNNFTGGNLQARFEENETTGRTEIIETDWWIFLENPIFGAGVGESYAYREKYLEHKAMSHTEFSRLVSEHGIFGVFALLVLAALAITQFKRQRSALGKALVGGVIVWSCLYMTNAGMRLAAPSFIWGISFFTISTLSQSFKRRTQKNKNLTKTPV